MTFMVRGVRAFSSGCLQAHCDGRRHVEAWNESTQDRETCTFLQSNGDLGDLAIHPHTYVERRLARKAASPSGGTRRLGS